MGKLSVICLLAQKPWRTIHVPPRRREITMPRRGPGRILQRKPRGGTGRLLSAESLSTYYCTWCISNENKILFAWLMERSTVNPRISINFADFAGYLRDFLFSLLMSSQKQSKLIKGTNLILLCAFSMRIRWCLYLIPAR